MTYKEFIELEVPKDCRNTTYLNFHFNDKDPTDLRIINGGIVYNGFFLISYDKYEMVYFKNFEICLVPDGPSINGKEYAKAQSFYSDNIDVCIKNALSCYKGSIDIQ